MITNTGTFITLSKSSFIDRPNVTHPPGDKNLVTCMRETLEAAYPELALGLGGVFSIRQGQAKFHVMPDFSPCPINTNEVQLTTAWQLSLRQC